MSKAKLVLRKQKLSNGNYPITIRLSHNRSSAYLRIEGFDAGVNEWNNELCRFNKGRDSYKELNTILSTIETKIDTLTSKLLAQGRFSFHNFKTEYYGESSVDNNVVNAFNRMIDSLHKVNRVGSALFYNDCLTAFKEYTKNKPVVFDEINYKFLQGFEQQRLKKGNSINTIAVYLRGLRSVHYSHCKLNNIESRPNAYVQFGIKTEATRHRALTKVQLNKLINYQPATKYEKRTVNIFLASFYMRGINLMDLAQLKKENIINNRIEYRRSKTGGLFSIKITPEIQTILEGFKDEASDYLFPIIKDNKNVKRRVVMFNRTFNKILKRISIKIGLPIISFYWARHSFASILRENNVGIDIISQALGHSNTKITEVYLNSFPDSKIDAVTDNIISGL